MSSLASTLLSVWNLLLLTNVNQLAF